MVNYGGGQEKAEYSFIAQSSIISVTLLDLQPNQVVDGFEQYICTEPGDDIVVQAGELIDFDTRRIKVDETNGGFMQNNIVTITGYAVATI